MSKKCPGHKKKYFLNTFGIKNVWPPEPPATARTPRPIFDDKKCPKNVFKMFFILQDIFLTFFRIFFVARRIFV